MPDSGYSTDYVIVFNKKTKKWRIRRDIVYGPNYELICYPVIYLGVGGSVRPAQFNTHQEAVEFLQSGGY